ncbi:MAG: isocitrate lyase/PEP mutase family protein [Chloroflexi bacterium]|nr:isocitrate lyase/PEP mutase family protein [Chloroflexota bacterium]
MRKTTKLRELINQAGLLMAPGCYDALTAKLIAEAGFPVIYITGAGVANSQLGKPDVGLTTMTELVWQARNITEAVDVPVFCDADTGYGNAINVMRTIREYERAGLAGLHLEDQITPKQCGHFDGKAVISKEEMVRKIEAAVYARQDPDFIIIARTDARAVTGFDDTIERAKAYRAAGADMIFFEAPQSVDELREVSRRVDAPLVANMVEGGKTPLTTATQLEEMGYKLAIYANFVQRTMIKAVQSGLAELKRAGTPEHLQDQMVTFEERQRIAGLPQIRELEARFLRF